MTPSPFHLLTPQEAEEELGKKYFYRQRIYRLAEKNKITQFKLKGQSCYLGSHIINATLKDLELRIATKFPEIDTSALRIFYDTANGKRVVVDGLFGKGITVNTDEETEEDLMQKITHIYEWMKAESEPIGPVEIEAEEELDVLSEVSESDNLDLSEASSLTNVLPEEILWVKVDTGIVEGVEVKSLILVSLPSIGQFVGIRPDKFIEWLTQTTFSDYVLSAHYKHLQGTEISVPWKKGVVSGYTPLVPFELLPEIIVAFKQSGRTVNYPEKAEMLYQIARTTLEAVGLAISGDKDKAAKELAKVGEGLGLTVADQIIGIFKQYESRDFQIQTNREFNSKVKEVGADYAITAGKLTFGITRRYPWQWKALGSSRNLPSKLRESGREVMRQLAPEDGVGVTFGERHYIKDPNVEEAVKTGLQGKDFYQRLKKVGLLED
jgi:hypothetical protein